MAESNQKNSGLEFEPEDNTTSLYSLLERAQKKHRKQDDQMADKHVVDQITRLLTRKQAVCRGDLKGMRLVID